MKKFTLLMATGLLLLATACSHHDEPLPQAITYTTAENQDLINVLINFDNQINGPHTRNTDDLSLLRIEETNYIRTDQEVIEVTETTRSDEVNDMFTIIKVDFDLNNRQCSALLKKRGNKHIVYYYSDNGYLIDGIDIPALNHTLYYVNWIDDITDMDKPDPTTPEPPIQTGSVNKEYLVLFQWGQDYPYNISFPTYTQDGQEKHYLVGCGAVAVGQAMATYKKYKSTLYPNSSLSLNNNNFIYLPKYAAQFTSDSQRIEVSQYLYDIAEGILSSYNPNNTGSHPYWIQLYLEKQGYNPQIQYGNLREDQLKESIKKKFPFIAFGENINEDAHVWLIDGIKKQDNESYYHCNWGWNGNKNCWIKGSLYTFNEEQLPSFNIDNKYIFIN